MSVETTEGTNDCRAEGNSETNDSGVETNFETLNDCEVIYALLPPLPEQNFGRKIQRFSITLSFLLRSYKSGRFTTRRYSCEKEQERNR